MKDEAEARFPDFVKRQPCPCGGKTFRDLSEELRQQLLETPPQIVQIETDDPNEARDLFVRLQAGMPLNSQEKRDAWPGQFTDFILGLGGKSGLAKYPGHSFFNDLMKASRTRDRGKFRQLAAQLSMLFLTRRDGGVFCDINADATDSYYYENLGFDTGSADARRLFAVLDRDRLGEHSLARSPYGPGLAYSCIAKPDSDVADAVARALGILAPDSLAHPPSATDAARADLRADNAPTQQVGTAAEGALLKDGSYFIGAGGALMHIVGSAHACGHQAPSQRRGHSDQVRPHYSRPHSGARCRAPHLARAGSRSALAGRPAHAAYCLQLLPAEFRSDQPHDDHDDRRRRDRPICSRIQSIPGVPKKSRPGAATHPVTPRQGLCPLRGFSIPPRQQSRAGRV